MKILVIQLDTAGDVLRTTPVIRGLREKYPSAYIGFLLEDRFTDILIHHPDIDEIFVIPHLYRQALDEGLIEPGVLLGRAPESTRLNPSEKKILEDLFHLRERLKGRTFDLVINLHQSLTSAIFTALSGGAQIVGNSLTEANSLRYEDPWPPRKAYLETNRNQMNRLDLYLLMAGVKPSQKVPQLYLGQEAKDFISDCLQGYGVNESDFVAVLQPGSGWERNVWQIKRWNIKKVARIGDEIQQQLGARVILIGAPLEQARSAAVAHLMEEPPLDLTGRTSLQQLGALIERANLFIGPDSGPTHMAVALSTPTIAVFGGISPLLYAPVGKNFLILQAELPCRPFYGCRQPCEETKCLQAIPAESLPAAYHLLKLLWHPEFNKLNGLQSEATRLVSRFREAGIMVFSPRLRETSNRSAAKPQPNH
ncbi:MAG: glycosyltransferase family 9 protein [bacterium]